MQNFILARGKSNGAKGEQIRTLSRKLLRADEKSSDFVIKLKRIMSVSQIAKVQNIGPGGFCFGFDQARPILAGPWPGLRRETFVVTGIRGVSGSVRPISQPFMTRFTIYL